MKFEITEFDPKDLSEDEVKEFYKFYLEFHKESAPMLPYSTFKVYKRDFTYVHPTDFLFRFAVKNEERLIGTGNIRIIDPSTDAPVGDKEKTWINVNIKNEWRNKGSGSALLKTLLERISKYPIKKAYIWASLESGKGFCRNLGGNISDSSYFNFLNLKTLNWKKISEQNKSLSEKTPDISIKVTYGLKGQDRKVYLDSLISFMDEISKYSREWDFDEDFFRSEYLVDEKRKVQNGEVSIIAYAKTAGGTQAGMSELTYDPAKPQEIYTEISGTTKEFRGQGLCKRMKTELLLFLKSNLPDVSVVTTANDEENSVMRAINDQLGFESLPISYGYSFKVDELKGRLQDVRSI